MKKIKLKCIEDYIFAKTLNLLAKNTIVSRENAENFKLVNYAKEKSEELLNLLNAQIKKLKLDNISLWVLNKELESANIYNDNERNLNKIKEMLDLF